jgi:hypothetical protein
MYQNHEISHPSPVLKASDPESWERIQAVLADDFNDQKYYRSKFRDTPRKTKKRNKYQGRLH